MTPLNAILNFLAERKLPCITLEQVCKATKWSTKPALRVLKKLEAEGYLNRINDGKKAIRSGQNGPRRLNPKWSLVKRQVYRDRDKTKPGPLRDKLWRLIRMRPAFTKNDLATIAGIGEETVRDYINLLRRHNHIQKIGRTRDGISWQLIIKNPPVKRPSLSEVEPQNEEQ